MHKGCISIFCRVSNVRTFWIYCFMVDVFYWWDWFESYGAFSLIFLISASMADFWILLRSENINEPSSWRLKIAKLLSPILRTEKY